MCNPRRVTITATRELDEAWQREVSQTVRLQEDVFGEARVRQALGETLSTEVRVAFEAALGGGLSGWREVEDGVYRHDVEGGYVQYHVDDGVLEIVGRVAGQVETEGRAEATLTGRTRAGLHAETTDTGYDDGYAGNTVEAAERRAREKNQRDLDRQARERIDAEMRGAEEQARAGLTEEARKAGQEKLRRLKSEKEAELRRQAQARLAVVGARARRAVSEALAHSYREAILSYARRNNAEVVVDRDDGGVVEIEFRLRG